MTPISRQKSSHQLNIGRFKGKELIANFAGGIITSDAGIVLIAELDEKLNRYHKIEHNPKEIERAFVDIFLESYKKPPKQIILDMDVTDDQVHGNQEGAFFNTYYKGVCYATSYIFCGHHLLVAKLRSSNVDPADGALEELQRVIKLIREK